MTQNCWRGMSFGNYWTLELIDKEAVQTWLIFFTNAGLVTKQIDTSHWYYKNLGYVKETLYASWHRYKMIKRKKIKDVLIHANKTRFITRELGKQLSNTAKVKLIDPFFLFRLHTRMIFVLRLIWIGPHYHKRDIGLFFEFRLNRNTFDLMLGRKWYWCDYWNFQRILIPPEFAGDVG